MGCEEEATADLRQRLEVVEVKTVALSARTKPGVNRDPRVKSITRSISILPTEYISPIKLSSPRAPPFTYDDAQKAADYDLRTRRRGYRSLFPFFDELPDANER